MTIQLKQSTDIVVDEFRQILIWPLLLRNEDGSKIEMSSVKDMGTNWTWAQQDNGKEAWSIGRDPWYAIEDCEDTGDLDYSEIVYFHSFVRNFLYGGDNRQAKDHPIRVFQLRPKTTAKPSPSTGDYSKTEGAIQERGNSPNEKCPTDPTIGNLDNKGSPENEGRRVPDLLYVKIDDQKSFYLNVVRIEAYVSESGVLMLVAEVFCNKKNQGPMDEHPLYLSDVMNLQNLLRMVFPRRWSFDKKTSTFKPKEAPLQLAWADIADDKQGGIEYVLRERASQDFTIKDDFTKVVREHAELPVAQHLRYLLEPFIPYGYHFSDKSTTQKIVYKQIEDQRIPSMSFIAVKEPRQITDWDLARITFFDGPEDSTVSSYSNDFMKDWMSRYTYDRFWQRTPCPPIEGLSDPAVLSNHHLKVRTLWLCCGYGFSVVGSSQDSFYMSQIRNNFHHHYFRMGFIAHFHRASLLALREELSESINKTGAAFHAAVIQIQNNSTRFRTRYWYHEVSTQLQGQEIFRWWSNKLGNLELFDRVTSDVEALASQVRTEIAENEAKNIKRLTVFGLLAGFAGMLAGIISTVITHVLMDWDKVTAWGRWEFYTAIFFSVILTALIVFLSVKDTLFKTMRGR